METNVPLPCSNEPKNFSCPEPENPDRRDSENGVSHLESFAWRIQFCRSILHLKYSLVLSFHLLQGVQLKSGLILIWVIYLLRFTKCYITQLTCIYSKCWKCCPFISMHLSIRFVMFLATFLSVLSFFNHFRNSTFYWRLPSKFFKELCLQWA